MTIFRERYTALNDKQRQAVDTIDGPVMVVAGPGTGKTELLSVRVANILDKTDSLPANILCLTFTDSATANMRDRLSQLLGPEAYKVAVHTFHSFGSEIINSHSEYFYSGAQFRAADELSTYEIMSSLLEKLPHDNPLASQLNGHYTYLRDIQTSISELKRAGLTPDELDKIVARNEALALWLKPKLSDVFAERISKKTLLGVEALVRELTHYEEGDLELPGYHPLATLFAHSLQRAVQDSQELGSTKPLTAWKNIYLEKDAHGAPVLKDERRSTKLRALGTLYYDYLVAMQKAERYDYDDMILRVVHALETFDELRFSLQEQYHYILVDEFQDTNDSQMRLIWNLTNNPASDGRPNLLVVGDDDQAIYRFQGAELSNILDFTQRYQDVRVITLTDNYRSGADILDAARSVIVQAEERLETSLTGISKLLTPHVSIATTVEALSYQTVPEAHAGLAARIAEDTVKHPNHSRAVIARHHRELMELLPHLRAAGVNVRYERQDNVLDSEPVYLLEQTAHVVWHLSLQEFEAANEHLVEILAHPSWAIDVKDIWQLSLRAHREKKYWLEIMLDIGGRLGQIAEWCIVGSAHARTETLEFMLDYLFGVGETDDFSSPYKDYFFGLHDGLSPTYLAHLAALQKIRAGMREYRPGTVLKLADFIAYLDTHHELDLSIAASTQLNDGDNSVVLLSAHKAKGLEFDTVYITDAVESIWGNSARSRGRLLSFPSNLPLSPAGDNSDERLRLLYVAMTRARYRLTIAAARSRSDGKVLTPVGALSAAVAFHLEPELPLEQTAETLQTSWYTPLLALPKTDQRTILTPLLEHYRLSATHLNNFLDVTKGGPEYFLLHNLLRLPAAMPPSAAYGSAVHGVLQRAHQHVVSTGHIKPVEDILHDFESTLASSQLAAADRQKFATRGVKALTTFFEQRASSFTKNQVTERNFNGDHVVVDGTVMNGALDLLDIDHDEKTIFVTDYKTGKASRSWIGKTDYDKVKLHHYEQQLMFYKLLLENSRHYAGYTVTGARLEFVEPDKTGTIVLLDYTYDPEQLQQFRQLIQIVWQRIQSLDFTTGEYPSAYSGIVDFEKFLLDQSI